MPRTHMSDATSARVGREVRRARAELGISQAELARRMGVKAPYVASLESGARNVTLGQLANIADALGRGLDITFPEVEAEYRRIARSATG
jgi:XRE family transcriptional regulator, fatty acid utilization regulator